MRAELKFVECSIEETRKSNNLYKLLNDFQNAGIACARVEMSKGVKYTNLTGNINKSAKRFGLHHINAVTRNKQTYLINDIYAKKLNS
jgi:hypothetical protein